MTIGAHTINPDAWRLRKAASLVKLLALAPGHALQRDELLDLLWPDLGPEAAANNLRYTLHGARRVIRTATDATLPLLQTQGERLVLYPDGPLWVDVDAFETAAAAARRVAEPAAYAAAIALYTGDLLPEDRYEDWATTRRELLRATWMTLLIDTAQLHEVRAEYSQAAGALERVVAAETTHEQAHVALMRLYALSGQRARAAQQYQQLREMLRQELDVEPDPASRRLDADIRAGRFPPADAGPAGDAAAPAATARRHNLPSSLTRFIGRERECVEVTSALATARLLSLVGTGGCGKSRLALAVAADQVWAYPAGVWLVELAGLSDPELVPAAVAAVLGVREARGRALTATLADALQSKRLLLVLDNCEHLIGAVADLASTLLSQCPDLSILATSREALRVAGEVTFWVPSLAVPDPRQAAAVEELREVEAVRLFLDRVQLRQPAFVLTEHNAPAIEEICHRLDGMPLAIELAAARAPVLSVEQLAARLSDALSVLTESSRTAVPRHRTLRATLDWSYDLLDAREQLALNRLAVFADGWTLEAAEAVISSDGIAEQDVLDVLSRLVDKSLVQIHAGAGEQRYRLLETIRQFAVERLVASGAREDVHERCARYYLALAERADPETRGPRQVEWLERLEREHDNLRAVLAWSLGRNDGETVARLGWALGFFWYTRGHLAEGRRWMDAVSADASSLPPMLRARALCVSCAMVAAQGDFAATLALGQEGLALARQVHDQRAAAVLLFLLGELARSRRAYSEATTLLEESLGFYRALGDAWGAITVLDNLGQIELARGDPVQATRVFQNCLQLAQETGIRTYVSESLTNLGLAAQLQGDYQRAMDLHGQSLELARELGYKMFIVIALQRIGEAALTQGDGERSSAAFDECLAVSREQGNRRGAAGALCSLGMAVLFQGDDERATTLLLESLATSRELGEQELLARCLEGLAAVVGIRGNGQRAATLWGAAERLREVIDSPLPPIERACYGYERYVSTARASHAEGDWLAAWSAGRALPPDQALSIACSAPEVVTPDPRPSPMPATLTQREHQVAVLVARGLTNHQIALELAIAQRTVDTHVSNLLRKLGLSSRAQVVGWARTRGLLAGDFP